MDTNAYRNAGELFGYLHQSLGFGELVMFMLTDRQSVPSVSFQWTFAAGKRRYCCEEVVDIIELNQLRSVKAFATIICEKWKDRHRGLKTPAPAPPPTPRPGMNHLPPDVADGCCDMTDSPQELCRDLLYLHKRLTTRRLIPEEEEREVSRLVEAIVRYCNRQRALLNAAASSSSRSDQT